MITKILPIVLLILAFYIGSIYSSRNLSKKLEKNSQIFHDPVIENYLTTFKSIVAETSSTPPARDKLPEFKL